MRSKTMKSCYLSVVAAACVVGQLSAQTLTDYQNEVIGQAPSNYFKLDGSLGSAINPSVLLSAFGPSGGFTYDVFGNSVSSYFYVASGDELSNEVDPLINTSGTTNGPINRKGSITFLFRSLSGPKVSGEGWLFDGRKILSGAGTTSHNALALWFERTDDAGRTDPGSLKLEFGDATTVILPANDLEFSSWYYFALTYDESRVPNKAIWYLGLAGQELTTGMTTNAADAVAGEENGLFVGNRSTTSGSISRPGNGRIDEFAIWARELSATEITNQFTKLPVAQSGGVVVTNVIVDDSFADGDRTATGPLQADWWSATSSSGNSVEAYTNQLGLISGTSGRGIHGTFAPQTLEVGDTIRATYTFTTPVTVGVNRSTALKVALMDFNNPGLAADLSSSSSSPQPLYFNLPGYMSDFDVNTGATADTNVREHNVNTTGRFLSTTAEWTSLGGSPDAGYGFTPNTEYVGVYSIKRTDFEEVSIFSSMSTNGVLMDSYTGSDSSGIANNYGMLGFAVGSRTFGSTNGPGEFVDNGITFSNIKVEVVTLSTEAPTLNIAQTGNDVVLFWLTSGSSGYSLESTPTLTPVGWTLEGTTPTIVGDMNYVTNSATGSETYYRLISP